MKKIRSLLALASLFVISTVAGFAGTITEDFATDPLQRGWQVFGDTNLFHWNSTNQNVEITWDSSTSNSYFYKALGTTLTKADAFALDFDIQLKDMQYANTFQIAVGLLNYSNATDPGFSRPLGTTPNLFEFDYFADDGYGEPNFAATLVDATAGWDFYFIYGVQPMNPGTTYHIRIVHDAGSGVLTGTVFANGQVYTSMSKSYPATINDFQLDTLSISSYSGAGQDPTYPVGSVLAHGTVDNFVATLPPPSRNLACAFNGSQPQVNFATFTNWTYTLQRSTDMLNWNDASAPVSGNGGTMTLTDTNGPSPQAFYRVRASQP